MDADGFSIVDNRAGVTFGVELYVPWNAPEMVVNISSASAVPLRNVPDVFGMIGCRDSATESCVLQGRDTRSIRVFIPDCRGLDQNFHDVTVVDMGDLPESHVSMPELSELAHKWPLAVINHMRWRQRELEEMRKAAKVQYRKKQPAPCEFCGLPHVVFRRNYMSQLRICCPSLRFCQSRGIALSGMFVCDGVSGCCVRLTSTV